ncbi:MAG: hypothetical protein ACD_22C00057G0001 [uncultured bacterium]|nr:MAG: hypothetical protein ACD_22C00057G0001 [uncultured bacterium]
MIVPGYNHEKYSITVESQGELGDYKLLIGEINNIGNWKNTEGRLTKIDQKDNYFYDGSTDQLSGDAKTIESSLKLYWPKKPKLSQVYDLRKSILEEVDKNIKENRVIDFDKNINKWRALDYFVASEYSKDKFFNHDGWDLGLKKIKPSRYFTKTNNYFSATLTSLQQEKEREYKAVSHKQLKLKIDKFIQVLMLKSFMRM